MLTAAGDGTGFAEEADLNINHQNQTRLGAHTPLIQHTPVTHPSGIKRSEHDDERVVLNIKMHEAFIHWSYTC
jgi:hypothetical protein